jgi:hypothetical protein
LETRNPACTEGARPCGSSAQASRSRTSGQKRHHHPLAGLQIIDDRRQVPDDPGPRPSWPRSIGIGRGLIPSTTERSEWHRPAASILTSHFSRSRFVEIEAPIRLIRLGPFVGAWPPRTPRGRRPPPPLPDDLSFTLSPFDARRRDGARLDEGICRLLKTRHSGQVVIRVFRWALSVVDHRPVMRHQRMAESEYLRKRIPNQAGRRVQICTPGAAGRLPMGVSFCRRRPVPSCRVEEMACLASDIHSVRCRRPFAIWSRSPTPADLVARPRRPSGSITRTGSRRNQGHGRRSCAFQLSSTRRLRWLGAAEAGRAVAEHSSAPSNIAVSMAGQWPPVGGPAGTPSTWNDPGHRTRRVFGVLLRRSLPGHHPGTPGSTPRKPPAPS